MIAGGYLQADFNFHKLKKGYFCFKIVSVSQIKSLSLIIQTLRQIELNAFYASYLVWKKKNNIVTKILQYKEVCREIGLILSFFVGMFCADSLT